MRELESRIYWSGAYLGAMSAEVMGDVSIGRYVLRMGHVTIRCSI